MKIEIRQFANKWSAWDGDSAIGVGTVREVANEVKRYIVEQLGEPSRPRAQKHQDHAVGDDR